MAKFKDAITKKTDYRDPRYYCVSISSIFQFTSRFANASPIHYFTICCHRCVHAFMHPYVHSFIHTFIHPYIHRLHVMCISFTLLCHAYMNTHTHTVLYEGRSRCCNNKPISKLIIAHVMAAAVVLGGM